MALGTPFSATATRVLLLGSGELGKEVAIECKRLGVEVIACDRYEHAPAMQVADRSYVLSMLDENALAEVIEKEQPHYIVPEIEAIATAALERFEQQGLTVVPNARAVQLTMNREGIRRLAAEELGIASSPYQFCSSFEEFEAATKVIGFPCVVKPIMSSSGKGQSVLRSQEDLAEAWQEAQEGGRAGGGRVIVEGFVEFDYEITLLTIRHSGGTSYCAPIGHRQEDGDYQESWQPQAMTETALKRSEEIAAKVTEALGGYGLFGVELFIKGDDVLFSEVSPRPHDTGMVTMISQNLSEFALHTRAFLGLPIPAVRQYGPAASAVIKATGETSLVQYSALEKALQVIDTDIRLFGKPEVKGTRRMGVALALGESIEIAKVKAIRAASEVEVKVGE
ncbi:phosphoribosylglycinamide formyltransferase 2 [Reinekea marinisedimentorum]|uniref:Formate-dependent phosphoribosylglycinamide formyltransferase n=2 Tax=Reinekea marinisedimentorum TaxID=230495 RepID=A0A4R3I6H4_9GAMM|nr:phosphoribosylglycinamide formyltransferase 2 [Reinekea marinisedimentorum]